MKIVFEAVSIFLICFVIAALSAAYGLIKQHILMVKSMMNLGSSMVMTSDERQSIVGLVVPFALFPLGAVVQNQLHHALFTPLPGLLITGVFIIFPFASAAGWLFLGETLARWSMTLPWNRARRG